MDALGNLEQRGFVQQCTGLEDLRALLSEGPVTYYVGFDPTADSLHVGHLLQLMAMSWLQRAGHRPIAVVGGGTVQVGDPSGRTELRQMLGQEEISANVACLRRQIEQYLVLDGERGLLVDNAEWLMELQYIPFLRDIGRHFSVNRMIAAEAYKQRLERGLSFIEFNYQILQSYDFLELYRRHGCRLQIGGDDQWGNILPGSDLIRRVEGDDRVHGLTTPLLTTASGAKMGKTAKGAVWLDPAKTSEFDWYQYWINVDDRDVGRFLRLYTFLDLDEVVRLEALQGADIREAKRVLARETTALVHGQAAADRAEQAARSMVAGAASADLPTYTLGDDLRLLAVVAGAGLTKSKGEARRVIKGGGVRVDGEKILDPEWTVEPTAVGPEGLVVRVGKKRAARVVSPV